MTIFPSNMYYVINKISCFSEQKKLKSPCNRWYFWINFLISKKFSFWNVSDIYDICPKFSDIYNRPFFCIKRQKMLLNLIFESHLYENAKAIVKLDSRMIMRLYFGHIYKTSSLLIIIKNALSAKWISGESCF